jgi:hypothetical protein
MLLPAQYLWLEPVIIAAVVVFVVSFIGNILSFGSRITNALVTAIVFAVIFGAVVYYGYGDIYIRLDTKPSATAPATK